MDKINSGVQNLSDLTSKLKMTFTDDSVSQEDVQEIQQEAQEENTPPTDHTLITQNPTTQQQIIQQVQTAQPLVQQQTLPMQVATTVAQVPQVAQPQPQQ